MVRIDLQPNNQNSGLWWHWCGEARDRKPHAKHIFAACLLGRWPWVRCLSCPQCDGGWYCLSIWYKTLCICLMLHSSLHHWNVRICWPGWSSQSCLCHHCGWLWVNQEKINHPGWNHFGPHCIFALWKMPAENVFSPGVPGLCPTGLWALWLNGWSCCWNWRLLQSDNIASVRQFDHPGAVLSTVQWRRISFWVWQACWGAQWKVQHGQPAADWKDLPGKEACWDDESRVCGACRWSGAHTANIGFTWWRVMLLDFASDCLAHTGFIVDSDSCSMKEPMLHIVRWATAWQPFFQL